MTVASATIESSVAAVLVDVRSEVLAQIGKDGVELARWQPALPSDLTQWLEELPASALQATRLELRMVEVVPALHVACDARGTPQGPMRIRGCELPGRVHDRGVVHRSPPIACSGISRLLLCMDVPPDWRGSVA